MDGEADWWTTSRNIGLPPLARVMGVGRQQQQRDHFSNQLEINKSDIRKSWKIFKSVIGSIRKSTQTVSNFIINNTRIINEQHIAN